MTNNTIQGNSLPIQRKFSSPLKPADTPHTDAFRQSAPPPGLMPRPVGPMALPPEEKEMPNVQSGGGRNFLMAATLAGVAVAGLYGGVAVTHQQEAAKPIQMTQNQADRAQYDLHYLGDSGQLHVESDSLMDRLRGIHTQVDADGAFETMAQGRTVYVTPQGSNQTFSVKGPEQLHTFTREVRDVRFKAGIRAIGQSFQDLGERISDQFKDAFGR